MTTDSSLEINQLIDSIPEAKQNTEIPFGLRELGEIPKGFVPVYLSVRSENLTHIAENGLRIIDNQMAKDAPEVEAIFSKAGKEAGIDIDRTKCVFAYPRHPDKLQQSFSLGPEYVLLEAWIDPNTNVMVADAETYSAAVNNMDYRESEDLVAAKVRDYWADAKTLKEYLSENHNGGEKDLNDFRIPEVLIPYDIPTNRIRVAK